MKGDDRVRRLGRHALLTFISAAASAVPADDGIAAGAPVFSPIWNGLSGGLTPPKTYTWDDHLLRYYRDPLPPMTWPELLVEHDGRCQAWAELMKRMLEVHSIPVSVRTATPRKFPNEPMEMFRVVDMWAQGGKPAKREFPNHALVEYNDKLWDPSYGSSSWHPYHKDAHMRRTKHWEDHSIEAFAHDKWPWAWDWNHPNNSLSKDEPEVEISN